jgi:hypothetical protein
MWKPTFEVCIAFVVVDTDLKMDSESKLELLFISRWRGVWSQMASGGTKERPE